MQKEKILVIGAGGREHALAWKYAQSASCESVFIAPGNAATAEVGENVALDVTDFAAVAAFVQDQDIDLVVIGPEQPLVDGMADYLVSQQITTLGPSQAAAQLEGSKDFSKAFMDKYKIPTAKYASFHTHELDKALDYVSQHPLPVVVKASGLAAGKGVAVCPDEASLMAYLDEVFTQKRFGRGRVAP